ncbi:WD40 repeat domain-containing protein [Micromonospora sp. D93]|uniref:WD40 repeat domain-containing protein n=1 Tax=Micromonospora sp. D93 TaxID=2824886 RepID=UPI001B39309A|nr:WD40 repeat domain-containing protein [Micromonospora sp. D93]MBQ1019793.1 WD40 repeat domain-containing protein [Micromonospora sp. D93]
MPEPDPTTPLNALRDRIKRLHREAGEPSTRDIASGTHKAISHTTVANVLRCQVLPRWGQVELTVEFLGGPECVEEFKHLWLAAREFEPENEGTLAKDFQIDSAAFDQTTFGAIQRLALRARAGTINTLAFSADSRYILSGGEDGSIHCWSLDSGASVAELRPAGTPSINGIAWSVDGKIAATTENGEVLLWAQALNTDEPVIIGSHTASGYGIEFSPSGNLIATAGHDYAARLWNPRTGQEIGEPLRGHSDTVYGLAFSADQSTLATASHDCTVRLWNVITGRQAGEPLKGHTAAVHAVAYAQGGQLLVSASHDRTVRIWNLANPSQSAYILDSYVDGTYALAVSRDILATAGYSSGIHLWDIRRQQRLRDISTRSGATALAFSPDTKYLASSDSSGRVFVWSGTQSKVASEQH